MSDQASKGPKKPIKKKDDVALVWGRSEDGETLGVLRKRGDEVQPALMKKAREGEPIHGELLQLKPRDEPLLYDIEVLHDPGASAGEPAGPAQVANQAYRKGWDRLFKRRAKQALN